MTFKGKVQNGVIVLTDGTVLPEGTAVDVTATTSNEPKVAESGSNDPIFGLANLAVDTGIPDLATNIDHYLYGHPKLTDG
jgi:hypothetical protein